MNWVCAPVYPSQWTQSDACRLKTVVGVGFEVTGNVTFQEIGFYNIYNWKINNYTSRTNRSIKVWILLGYPSKYCNYTSNKKLGRVPHTPHPVDNFFNIHLTKKIMNIKDVEFYFRMGCVHVLFPLLWIINVQFTNFVFLILWCSN